MASHQRLLDLERYRRMKNRMSPKYASPFGASTPKEPPSHESPTSLGTSGSRSTRRAPPTPDPYHVSSDIANRVLCGVLVSNEKLKPSAVPSATSIYEDARRRRFDKFRSRSRPPESPTSARESLNHFFPSTPAREPSTLTKQGSKRMEPEGSPMRPIVLDDDIPILPSESTMSLNSIPSPPRAAAALPRRSLGSRRTPILHKRHLASTGTSSSAVSTTSSERDRIEEARDKDEDGRAPFSEIRTSPDRDRIEATRGEDGSTHASLGIPSLHSRYSIEPSARPSFDGKIIDAGHSRIDELSLKQSESSGVDEPPENYRGPESQVLPRRRTNKTISRPRLSSGDRVEVYRDLNVPSKHPTIDQRTVRLLYSTEFSDIIASYQKDELYLENQNENRTPLSSGVNGVSFVVRKRPISKFEIQRGDFDVVAVGGNDSRSVKVYKTQIQADRKTKQVTPVAFQCDIAFSDSYSAEEFYVRVGQPMVLTAKAGRMATIITCGQVGAGKTYTLTDIEERAVYDLFAKPPSTAYVGPPSPRVVTVWAQYVELCGAQCNDLLGPPGSLVRVVEKAGGTFKFKGALSKPASSPRELLKILSGAKRRRAAVASVRSRADSTLPSHVICQITVGHGGREGCLTLLECAGTNLMSSSRQEDDSKEITSDQLLMKCLRDRVSGRRGKEMHLAYRSSNLTKIMQESFEKEDSRFCIVANVSPNATDTESTLETLETLSDIMASSSSSIIKSFASREDENEELVLPRQWSHFELVGWMKQKRLLGNPVPSDVNGRFAMRMSKIQLKNTFYDPLEDARAEKLFVALRAENDRVSRLRVKRRMAREKVESVY